MSFQMYLFVCVNCLFMSFAYFSVKTLIFFSLQFLSSLYVQNQFFVCNVYCKYVLPVCHLSLLVFCVMQICFF